MERPPFPECIRTVLLELFPRSPSISEDIITGHEVRVTTFYTGEQIGFGCEFK